MKKILIAFAAVLFVTSACDYDLKPTIYLPNEEAIETVDEYKLALYGVYEMMVYERGSHGSDLTFYADTKGGDVNTVGDNGMVSPFIRYEVTRNSSVIENIYYALYKPIAFANMAMFYGDSLSVTQAEEKQWKDIHGQLVAVRAFLHFDAARLFAQLPTVNGVSATAEDTGIVISDEYYKDVNKKFKRATLAESYKFIIDELEESLKWLDPDNNTPGEINVWGVKGLLARAYLYNGDYDNAYKYAVDVIDNSPYKLFTPENYKSAWARVGQDEFIFEILTSTSNSNNAQRNSLGYYTNAEGYAEVGVGDNIMPLFQALSDDDIRKTDAIEHQVYGNKDGYFTIKYPGQEGANSVYVNNPKIVRLAELYYIASEAALKGATGASAGDADKYYNELRESRYEEGTYVPVTGVTLDDILEERRIELFCENHRLFDLVRNNLPVPHYDDPTKFYQPSDPKIISPFPLSEMDVNDPLLKQNPEY